MIPPAVSLLAKSPRGEERAERPALRDTERAAAIVDLLDRLASAGSPEAAYSVLVTELEAYLKCKAVLLGLATEGRLDCRLSAATAHWNPQERAAIEAAMAERLSRGEDAIWPAPEAARRHALLAHQALADVTRTECVMSLLLQDRRGLAQGVILVLGDASLSSNTTAQQFLKAAAQPVASALSLAKLAEPSWGGRLLATLRSWARSHKLTAVFAGLALVAGVMTIPVPYRVACECELQPVTRRFVAAPFDGTLERTAVEPGDLVTKGQLLATMDGREIRWELAGVVAEQSQAAKERDGHLAKHDFGAAQLAKLEVERLTLRERLLTQRSEHLEIRSPLDGLVVTGDLKKSEGVPLAVGERLFEVAPLDSVVMEIAIPEADVAQAKVGQPVEIVLEAYPETTWTGPLARIHPRAEIRDDEHVFIGEVVLANPEAVLRPGMRGRAKVQGPSHPLGWNLFHKPWHELLYWLGW